MTLLYIVKPTTGVPELCPFFCNSYMYIHTEIIPQFSSHVNVFMYGLPYVMWQSWW